MNGRVAAAERTTNQPIEGSEYEAELFYSLRLTPGLVVRPNGQYVVEPGDRRHVDNAVVLGLKTAISL